MKPILNLNNNSQWSTKIRNLQNKTTGEKILACILAIVLAPVIIPIAILYLLFRLVNMLVKHMITLYGNKDNKSIIRSVHEQLQLYIDKNELPVKPQESFECQFVALCRQYNNILDFSRLASIDFLKAVCDDNQDNNLQLQHTKASNFLSFYKDFIKLVSNLTVDENILRQAKKIANHVLYRYLDMLAHETYKLAGQHNSSDHHTDYSVQELIKTRLSSNGTIAQHINYIDQLDKLYVELSTLKSQLPAEHQLDNDFMRTITSCKNKLNITKILNGNNKNINIKVQLDNLSITSENIYFEYIVNKGMEAYLSDFNVCSVNNLVNNAESILRFYKDFIVFARNQALGDPDDLCQARKFANHVLYRYLDMLAHETYKLAGQYTSSDHHRDYSVQELIKTRLSSNGTIAQHINYIDQLDKLYVELSTPKSQLPAEHQLDNDFMQTITSCKNKLLSITKILNNNNKNINITVQPDNLSITSENIYFEYIVNKGMEAYLSDCDGYNSFDDITINNIADNINREQLMDIFNNVKLFLNQVKLRYNTSDNYSIQEIQKIKNFALRILYVYVLQQINIAICNYSDNVNEESFQKVILDQFSKNCTVQDHLAAFEVINTVLDEINTLNEKDLNNSSILSENIQSNTELNKIPDKLIYALKQLCTQDDHKIKLSGLDSANQVERNNFRLLCEELFKTTDQSGNNIYLRRLRDEYSWIQLNESSFNGSGIGYVNSQSAVSPEKAANDVKPYKYYELDEILKEISKEQQLPVKQQQLTGRVNGKTILPKQDDYTLISMIKNFVK